MCCPPITGTGPDVDGLSTPATRVLAGTLINALTHPFAKGHNIATKARAAYERNQKRERELTASVVLRAIHEGTLGRTSPYFPWTAAEFEEKGLDGT